MDANMDVVLENIETKNIQLSDSLRDVETENSHLMEQVNLLKKSLEKEKKFHRKFAEDVVETEKLRLEDFKKEKRTLAEENKLLVKENRQLRKDVEFYKNAHAELAKEETIMVHNHCSKPAEPPVEKLHQQPENASLKSTRRNQFQAAVNRPLPSECTHKSSKVLSKANEKLFLDNKKFQSKIINLNATIAILKKKNKQLENFRTKVDNKKTKFWQDSEELARLVASTQKKNKDTFNSEALAMLGRLK